MKRVLICFGTRPEWIKVKPLLSKFPGAKLLFTGQHKDLLKDVEVNYTVEIKENVNRLDQVISDCVLQFPKEHFDYVIVHGDTVSGFACALAAYARKLTVVHLEAGLRSYDLSAPFPEEGYRQMISRIASINLAPTSLSAENLRKENVLGNTYVVGNSVLDNLIPYKDLEEYTDKVLVTLHRWENHHWMDKWFVEVNNLAKANPSIEFILPLHPNPNVSKHKHLLTNVKVVDPLTHDELLRILVKCKLVISDSGGIQEEGAFFNKKVIVCRTTTERPEGLGTGHLFLCNTPKDLSSLFSNILTDYKINVKCPYGNGDTATQVFKVLNNKL